MTFKDFVRQLKGFSSLSITEKILYAGYYLHTIQGIDRFRPGMINVLFDEVHIERPSNAASQMTWISSSFGKRLLKDSKGFRLNATVRDQIEKSLMQASPVAQKQVAVDLRKLEGLVTDAWQKVFLHETIVCYENQAYRASIVMAWNLAYYHVCHYILKEHLDVFNHKLSTTYSRKNKIVKQSDFEDLKEGQVIEVAKSAQIFSVTTAKTLTAKIDIRNTAAHPSSTVVMPVTAEEFIADLVQNIILKPTL